jgi:glycosyltransferase involved in cell wall biosynthesis
VVQESDWLKRGPHQQHHLIERLMKRGHRVRVIDYEVDWNKDPEYKPYSKTRSYKVPGKIISNIQVKIERPTLIRAPILCYASILIFHTISIIRIIKSFKPDVIIGLGILNANISARIARFFRIPFVYYLIDSLHTLIPEKYLQPLGSFIESRILKIADLVLAINKHLGSYAIKMGSKSEPQIITAGVDKIRFNPKVDGTSIRRELKIGENEIVIFFMGWLYRFSGLQEVIETVLKSNSSTRLLILGKGELQEEIKEISAKSHRNSVTIIDWVPYDEVPRYIAAADVCILPSHSNEIMRNIVPIKLYEYLACGKPVISTKLPGVMNQFGRNSGVVYVNSPYDVYTVARDICGDKEKYTNLSNSAEKFTDSLDWNCIVDLFLETLSNLILGRSGL